MIKKGAFVHSLEPKFGEALNDAKYDMIPIVSSEGTDGNCINGSFLCGVVEGFYGKPWSTDQRKKLFQRMKKMGLNTYLYAPKDDCKHRVYWRDLYSVEEADHLTNLIEAASENNVDFVYALSPGLDITFSSTKEVTHLKRKLEQVASFGCKSFALLFDDIEVDMCEADKSVFQSFAQAQVSVSNETYQYLSQPRFLFCPTEYCATRAVPCVGTSEYLNTIGSKLLPGIDIMWTGPRVVSKKITLQSIEEVAKVLQRPPVIWDNIHANDYDQKRVFLGPYDGRSPDLIPYLRGVLTNPNCEFEANYIAMHTLAQWCKSNVDGVKKDIILSSSPITSDIKLETESDCSDEDLCLNAQYHPYRALTSSINDWLDEIHTECKEPKKVVCAPVQPPLTPVTPATGSTVPIPMVSQAVPIPTLLAQAALGVNNINELTALAEVNDALIQPSPGLPLNSLIDNSSSDSESESVGEPTVEPMDCVITPGSSPVSEPALLTETAIGTGCTKTDSVDTMQVEPTPSTSCRGQLNMDTNGALTFEDVQQITNLFFLPLEHGPLAVELLNDFCWIKMNAHVMSEAKAPTATEEKKMEAQEWQNHCQQFELKLTKVMDVLERFCHIPNRALVYDLFPYLWDMKEMLLIVHTFVRWLELGNLPYISVCYMQGGPCTWNNKLYRDAFMSGDQEPWFFRGGLQAEFQRLMPLDGMLDLLTPCVPPTPTPQRFEVRPYLARDESDVYSICRRTCDDGMDGTEVFPDRPDLIGDKIVGSFLATRPDYCFIMESETEGMIGYTCATLDSRQFRKNEVMWQMSMQEKYPKPTKVDDLSPTEEMILSLYSDKPELPDSLFQRYPSRLQMSVLPEFRENLAITRRCLVSTLLTLKANGSPGVYIELPSGDQATIGFFTKLGFFDISALDGSLPEDTIYMGRAM